MDHAPLSGRRAEAARNNARILAAARDVFVEDPTAPIADVAARAGVGISALYRRYASKEDLLRTLCLNGQQTYNRIVTAALDSDGDPWQTYVTFLLEIVEADTHALTARLAGLFEPSDENFTVAVEIERKTVALFERVRESGVLRPDVTRHDLDHVMELFSALRLHSAPRSAELRQRYLTIFIDGLVAKPGTPLPGTPPTSAELDTRWIPRH